MGGLGDAGSHAVAANPGLPHVVGEPGTIIGGMDDEVYALLTRLIALAPDGDAGVNALVRSTCAAALFIAPADRGGRTGRRSDARRVRRAVRRRRLDDRRRAAGNV